MSQTIASSPLQRESFEHCCQFAKVKPLRMRYDVPTRWNSAYLMLQRAVYLRKAIDQYITDADSDNMDLSALQITKVEWEQVEMLMTILLPFKRANVKLQKTSHPRIDHVFWTYETLFNRIDKLKATLGHTHNRYKPWCQALLIAVDSLFTKLSKYYAKTEKPFVYSDSVILEPSGKLLLFEQPTFEPHFKEQYRTACRKRYMDHYDNPDREGIPFTNLISNKRKYDSADDSDGDDYAMMLRLANSKREATNEFDFYLSSPSPVHKDTLGWWKANSSSYSRLSIMARDTFAVPATGAGVEREFSKSGRVATATRGRLNASTVSDIMIFKNWLARGGHNLIDTKDLSEDFEERCSDTEDDDIDERNNTKRLFQGHVESVQL